MMRLGMELPQQVMQQNLEPMLVDEAEASAEEVIIVNNPTLELEFYAAQYSGLAKLNRLLFIADRCPTLRIEALRMALDHIMGTLNVPMYQQIHKKLCDAINSTGNVQGVPDVAEGNELPPLDTQWIDSRLKQAALKGEKLETDLKNYKSNAIKESIRRGTDDLGEHYLDCGQLNDALRAFNRARDHITSGKHVVDYCLNVARVSLYLQYWQHVECYVGKAENTPEILEVNSTPSNGQQNATRDSLVCRVTVNKLRCCNGIADLAVRNYKKAALRFLQTEAYHCEFPDIIAAKDVAVYAGLCALATFERPELNRNIINHQNFKQYLELDPQLREIIYHFYESRYGECLLMLDAIKDNLLLDIYLSPHVNALYGQIRNRAWIQYFSPYLSADMARMARAFNTTVQQVEEEIMQLILDNQIQARIDSHNKILYAKNADQRSSTFERCIEIGDEFEKKTKALMLRAALIKNKVVVKSPMRMVSTSCMTNGDGEKVNT